MSLRMDMGLKLDMVKLPRPFEGLKRHGIEILVYPILFSSSS